MFYDYYVKITSDEHMLFAYEIANMYNIRSLADKPHSLLIRTVIIDYMLMNNISYIPIYYETKNGLKEVFSKNIYEPAINMLLNSHNNIYKSINNKKYHFKTKGE